MKEKSNGCIGGFQRFSTEDGNGIRTTLFLKGCPLKCSWCHNPELISPNLSVLYNKKKCILCGDCVKVCPSGALVMKKGQLRIDQSKCTGCGLCEEICCSGAIRLSGKKISLPEIMTLFERDRTFYENTDGGITLSGGEILFNPEFAYAILLECVRKNIAVTLETSGFGNFENLYILAKDSQNILYDLKMMDDEKHKKYVGVSNQRVLENLRKLANAKDIYEKILIRMPLISGVNDWDVDIQKAINFLNILQLKKIEILPYHSMGLSKSKEMGVKQKRFETPTDEKLLKIQNDFINSGIQAKILGFE